MTAAGVASSAAIDGLAGAAAGVVALTISYPLMTISTKQSIGITGNKPSDPSPPPPTSPSTPSTRTPLAALGARLVALQALYRGLQPALIGTVASQGVYFYLYASLRRRAALWEKSKQGDISTLSSLLVAAAAGALNVLATNPIWLISTRMQVGTRPVVRQAPATASALDDAAERGQAVTTEGPLAPPLLPPPEHHGFFAVSRDLYHQDGILGFWKGVVPSLFMVSNPTIQYVVYEWLLKRLRALRAGRLFSTPQSPSPGQIFVASSLAKTVATILTYPMLTVKSRLQVSMRHADGSAHYHGTLDAVRKILRHEGLAGFYRGMKWKLVQSVLAASILFVSKEEIAIFVRSLLMSASK